MNDGDLSSDSFVEESVGTVTPSRGRALRPR